MTSTWVDVWTEGDDGKAFASRLVARDFKPKRETYREHLFAAMPPLEAKKLLFRMAVAGRRDRKVGGDEDSISCSSMSGRPT